MNFKQLRVAHKLWGTILGLLVAMLLTATWAQLRAASVMMTAIADVQRYEALITDAVKWKGMTETNVERVFGSTVTTDANLAGVFDARLKAGIGDISALQADIAKRATSEADKRAMDAVAQARTEVLALTRKAAEIKQGGDPVAVQSFVDKEFNPAIQRYLDTLSGIVKAQEMQRDQAVADAVASRRAAGFTALALACAVVALGIAVSWRLVRSVTQPLQQAVDAAGAIARGDLTHDVNVDRHDEFGQLQKALNDMVARLRNLVTEVRTGVESVSTASVEIATGNQDLSSRTEQTASSLQQTASSMEQLTGTVSQSADTARQANQLASTAANAALRGGEVVGQVVSSMQQISDSSRKIADIIGVIDGIAFQTNILALNAAVEAARAGEQGRGFAVVAGEVRNLAQRSAQAAREIKSLINASVETVESGSQQVGEAGRAMEEIVGSVRRVTDLIAEISASSTEQRDGIGQVNQAVAHLDQMTQQNAALVEESAAAAASLRDQAQRLAEVVSVFNVGHVGGTTQARMQASQAIERARTTPAAPVARPAPVPAGRPAALAAVRPSPAAAPAAREAVPASDDDWETF